MGTCERCGRRFLRLSPKSRYCDDCKELILAGKSAWVRRALENELPASAFGAWAHAGVRS